MIALLICLLQEVPFPPDPPMPAYALPDPLITVDGRKISTAEDQAQ